MTEKPWLVLTLRRTGGTSLTSFLQRASQFPRLQHEPLNPGRALGHIANQYRKDQDAGAARAALADALQARPNIKHCIELVPLRVSQQLIELCHELGYYTLVLTRRSERRRQLSRLIAQSTGVWGPGSAGDVYERILAGTFHPAPINLSKLAGSVRVDIQRQGEILATLRNRQIPYEWLVFEEIYSDQVDILGFARALAGRIGIDVADDPSIWQRLLVNDSQSSRPIEPFVPNLEEARQLLADLCVD